MSFSRNSREVLVEREESQEEIEIDKIGENNLGNAGRLVMISGFIG